MGAVFGVELLDGNPLQMAPVYHQNVSYAAHMYTGSLEVGQTTIFMKTDSVVNVNLQIMYAPGTELEEL